MSQENSQNNTAVSFVIPWIDWGMQPINPNAYAKEQRAKLDRLLNSPSTIWGWALIWKVIIGVIVWILMAVLFYVLFLFVWWLLGWWAENAVSWAWLLNSESEFAWIISLLLGFVVSFVGTLFLMVIYTFFFSWRYSNIWKTVGLLLLTNGILAIGMAVIFLTFKDLPNASVVGFVLYVCLASFLSMCQMEFVVNPNYSASSLMWCCLGFCFSISVLSVMLAPALLQSANESKAQMMIFLTPILVFPLMILWQGLWDIVYGKFYELGSNPFYLKSRAELDTETLMEEQKLEYEHEGVNVNF